MLETDFGCVSQQGLCDSQSQPTRHPTSEERSPTAGCSDANSGCWTIRSSVVTYEWSAFKHGLSERDIQRALDASIYDEPITTRQGNPGLHVGGTIRVVGAVDRSTRGV